jgi:hypothetical protein
MNDVEPDTDEAQMSHSDHDETTMNFSQQPADYRPSQWVVVKYASKRSVSYYLGQVMEKVYKGVKITFIKRQPGSKTPFKLPVKEEIDVVQSENIVDSIQQPVMNRINQFVIEITINFRCHKSTSYCSFSGGYHAIPKL